MIHFFVLFFLAFSSGAWAQEAEAPLAPLLPAKDLRDRVMLLATDQEGFCSAEVVRVIPPARCANRKIIHQVVSADHCIRNQETGDIDAKGMALVKQVEGGTTCVANEKQSHFQFTPNNTRRPANVITLSQAKKSPWTYDKKKFRRFPLGKVSFSADSDFKRPPMPKAQGKDKGVRKVPVTLMQEDDDEWRKERGVMDDDGSFHDEEDFEAPETPPPFKNTYSPDISKLKLVSDELSVSSVSTAACPDRMAFEVTPEQVNRMQITPFELANDLPAPGEKISVMGFQYGCNPTGFECEFTGTIKTDGGRMMESAKCKTGHTFLQGMSGGPIVNAEGKMIGILHGFSETDGVINLAFQPMLESDIGCRGLEVKKHGVQSRKTSFLNAMSSRTGNYEFLNDENGCYIEGSWQSRAYPRENRRKIPVPTADPRKTPGKK